MDRKDTVKIIPGKDRRPATRRMVQLYAALLHNAYLRGFIDGKIYEGNAKYFCSPGLNCYSCPGAIGSCPLGALQNALSSAGHRAGWYILGIILLYGIILGRTVCGWLCPFGLIQELLHRIPTLKIRKGRMTRALSWAKYIILAVFVIAIPLYYALARDLPYPGFCKFICPAGTLEGAAGHLAHPGNASMYGMLGLLFTRKWVILAATGLLCVFCYRGFCRFICPLGALYSLFNRFSMIGVRVDTARCNGCGACVHRCGMDVRHVGDHECIHCGECMKYCPQGAISLKAGKITLKAPDADIRTMGENTRKRYRQRKRILWAAALAVMGFALVWFNFLDPSIRNEGLSEGQLQAEGNWQSDAAAGYEEGMVPGDFSLECYDGSTFRLSDTRGKVTVINRWATWCAPCIRELPYFNDLYRAHEGDIAMIVIHPSLVVEDPEAFVAGLGLDVPCATDLEGDPVKEMIGGTATLPQTVVLNRRGEVVYNSVQSVTPEVLEALYLKAAEQ